MRRNAQRLSAATAAVVLVLGGCGDDEPADGDDTTVVETTAAETTIPADTTIPAETTAAGETTAGPEVTSVATTSASVPAPPTPPAAPTTPSTAAASASTAPSGFVFTSPDGSFTLTYPAEPTTETIEAPLPEGGTLPVDYHVLQVGTEGFVSSSITYAEGVVASLDGAVEGAIANSGAVLVSDEPIELAGRQGRQFVGDIGSGTATLISRIYVDGNRLWQVLYTGTGALTATDPTAAAFLDSFQFTETG